jgi:hypothetical protein
VEESSPFSPEDARDFAEKAVESARKFAGIELDFTPESLKRVDQLLDGWHGQGQTCQSMPTTVYLFGSYLGEVIIRNHGGRWRVTAEVNYPSSFPVCLEMPGGGMCNPLGKACKLLDNGSGDSLSFFYQVVTSAKLGETLNPPS